MLFHRALSITLTEVAVGFELVCHRGFVHQLSRIIQATKRTSCARFHSSYVTV